jgi:hypothetical protein
MQTEIGFQSRYDVIMLDLTIPARRQILSPIRSDAVHEGSVGVFAQKHVALDKLAADHRQLARRFLPDLGQFLFSRRPIPATPLAIGSPKFSVVLGPFARTEVFINAGEGFHGNDARGVAITESPADGSALQSLPFLVKTRGAEIGLRTKTVPKLDSSVSCSCSIRRPRFCPPAMPAIPKPAVRAGATASNGPTIITGCHGSASRVPGNAGSPEFLRCPVT